MTNVIANLVNEVLNAFAGNSPTAPVDSPMSWLALAAVRRDLSGAAISLASTNPITVSPTLTFTDGIVYGSANATDSSNLPLTYTIVSGPSQGGKITFIPASELPPNSPADTFSYLPYSTVLTGATVETFTELVSQTTPFDTALENLPLFGSLVQPILLQLYQTPSLNTLLAPLIGYAVLVPFSSADVPQLTSGVPAAFTTKVTSFDGTQISTNFFPASGLQTGQTAPTILNGPGLAAPGNTDPNSQFDTPVPGLAPLRGAGYDVVTWDPRGEFASGGVLQLDNPAFEGRDVSAIIDFVAGLPDTQLDAPNNPRMGMVGGSYGGGIQLVSAAIDPRIDAIVPSIAWNSLTSSLYPNQAFKTSFASLLVLSLVQTGARINPQIYTGILTGALLGFLTPSDVATLDSSGPGSLVSQITAPTLLIQGTADDLFPLRQAVTNAQLLAANGVPVKMIWFCGGHGVCLDPVNKQAQAQLITADTLAWLQQYVKQDGTPSDTIPTFQWVDQNGNFFSSDLMPSNPAFQGTPITATSTGGTLPIVPLIGGSGPQSLVPAPLSLALASKATNALNLNVPIPTGTQVVGAPQLTFTYSGIGTSHTVYAQIVDNNTGLVLGNIITPIPVTLDGRTHTVSVALGQLDDIAYTAPPGGGTLTLQLVGSATPFLNLTSFGGINVSGMMVSLPTVGESVGTPESLPASAVQLTSAA